MAIFARGNQLTEGDVGEMLKAQFCKHNLQAEGEQVVQQAQEELKQATLEIAPCVEECGVCGSGPFAKVNGEVVQAETVPELVAKVKQMA